MPLRDKRSPWDELLEIREAISRKKSEIQELYKKEDELKREIVGFLQTGESEIILTRRETEVLRIIAEGPLLNKEIADKLCISERTVKFHVSNLLRKYGVANRMELTTKFISFGGSMKKLALTALLLLLSAFLPNITNAQAHSVKISWVNSPDTANSLVYRLAGTCPTSLTGFTKLTASPVTTATYTDTTVNAATTYAYYVTAFLNNVESVPSNCTTATVPVSPPSGLSITSVAINNVNGQDRLQVDWTDTNGTATSVNIFGGQGQSLKQVSQTTTNGVYSYAILIPVQGGSISICDASGCVTQKFTGI